MLKPLLVQVIGLFSESCNIVIVWNSNAKSMYNDGKVVTITVTGICHLVTVGIISANCSC